jgi:hypothetical protein
MAKLAKLSQPAVVAEAYGISYYRKLYGLFGASSWSGEDGSGEAHLGG